MADNMTVKDASGVTQTVRTSDVGTNLHVPIHRLDGSALTGPAAQSVLNTDLLTGDVNGWFDASAYFSGTIQIVAGAGITAGAIIFEQTNDASSTTGIALPAQEASSVTANPIVAAVTIAASTRRAWQVSITMKYIRVRISTAFAGGTVQALASFAQQPYAYPALNVQQATAGSLQATVTPAASTASFTNSAASTNATSVKTSAGTLYSVAISNTAASTRFLKLYNLATAPTVGTSVPVLTIPIPANSVVVHDFGTLGLRFLTGIAFAITAAAADTDATAIGASEVKAALAYT